jgi:predicted HAD superfamily phosphohydrolase YqeG
MGDSYRAILKGDQLEWTDVVPSHLASEQPVEVTILDEPDRIADRRRRMAEALEKLAAADAFSGISDPSEWQREIRKDRPLPGRED